MVNRAESFPSIISKLIQVNHILSLQKIGFRLSVRGLIWGVREFPLVAHFFKTNGLKVRQPYVFGPTNEGLFTVRRRSSTGFGILNSV